MVIVTQGSDALGTFYQIVDNTAARDGTDKVYGVESFQFADQTRSNPINAGPLSETSINGLMRLVPHLYFCRKRPDFFGINFGL